MVNTRSWINICVECSTIYHTLIVVPRLFSRCCAIQLEGAGMSWECYPCFANRPPSSASKANPSTLNEKISHSHDSHLQSSSGRRTAPSAFNTRVYGCYYSTGQFIQLSLCMSVLATCVTLSECSLHSYERIVWTVMWMKGTHSVSVALKATFSLLKF